MDKATSADLLTEIRKKLEKTDGGSRLVAGLSLLVEDYLDTKDQLADTKLQLLMVQFDRDCLTKERLELEVAMAAEEEWAEDDELVQQLIAEGIPRHMKIKAIKFIRQVTGWGLRECKDWVEAHYFQPE